jgi:5,10-methylenetetrahydromethanopterin reductase
MPRDPATALTLARVAEEAGVDVFGVADSQHLFGGTYPVVQHVLAGTSRLRSGPLVTNPVTQHPSVHAASLATLASLYPGRLLAAFGAGDSAVRSVGLRPASPAELAEAVRYISTRLAPAVPADMVPAEMVRAEMVRAEMVPAAAAPAGPVPLWVAVSGPKAAAAVPPAASAVLLGGGLEPAWLRELADLAEASAGHPLQRWAFLAGSLVADSAQTPAARAALAVTVAGISRHGMTTDPIRAGAPPELVPGLRALYAQLDVRGHGQPTGRNRDVLAAWPAQAEYLYSRFAVVGTPHQAAEHLRPVAAQTGLAGFIFSSTVPDPTTHINLIGRELAPQLRGFPDSAKT